MSAATRWKSPVPKPGYAPKTCEAVGCETVFYVPDPWKGGEHKAPPRYCSNRCRTKSGPWSFPANKAVPQERGIYYPSRSATREVN